MARAGQRKKSHQPERSVKINRPVMFSHRRAGASGGVRVQLGETAFPAASVSEAPVERAQPRHVVLVRLSCKLCSFTPQSMGLFCLVIKLFLLPSFNRF